MKTGKTLTTRHEVAAWCPHCFAGLSASTCITDAARPEPGDYTVCIFCASVLRFDERMDLQMSKLEDIPTHSRLNFARAVQAVKAAKQEPPIEPWKC